MLCGRGGASTRRVILWIVRAPAQAITRFQETVSCRNVKQLICGSTVGSFCNRTGVHDGEFRREFYASREVRLFRLDWFPLHRVGRAIGRDNRILDPLLHLDEF
jgi:hypothetical protein